jgi:hypothetical protein
VNGHNQRALALQLIFWTDNRNSESHGVDPKRGFHSHNKDGCRGKVEEVAGLDIGRSEDRANVQESEHSSLSRARFRLEAAKMPIDKQGAAVVRWLSINESRDHTRDKIDEPTYCLQ